MKECKIQGFHGSDYVECHLRDVKPCGSCKNQRFGVHSSTKSILWFASKSKAIPITVWRPIGL
jgi:hypothetical protein